MYYELTHTFSRSKSDRKYTENDGQRGVRQWEQYFAVGDRKAAVMRAWKNVSTNACQKMVSSMREHFKSVLRSNSSPPQLSTSSTPIK